MAEPVPHRAQPPSLGLTPLSRVRLDELLQEMLDRVGEVVTSRERLRALLDALVGIGSDLDLRSTLQRIVEAACALVGARFGALGVIGRDQGLSDFIAHGVDEAAIRAPSLHNTQLWLFRLRDGEIEVRSDRARELPVADRTGWAVRTFGDRPRGPGRDLEPEPLVAIMGTRGDRPVEQIAAGQALQRVLLTVTDAGLAASMISQPIEVAPARDQLRRALSRTGVPQMALRIGYGVAGRPTPRRPLDEVLTD